ncbi:hypothetical protein ACOME3_003942 [Neoechinorhynchus agilis]
MIVTLYEGVLKSCWQSNVNPTINSFYTKQNAFRIVDQQSLVTLRESIDVWILLSYTMCTYSRVSVTVSEMSQQEKDIIENVSDAVFAESEIHDNVFLGDVIRGPKYPSDIATSEQLLSSFRTIGIQASKLYDASEIILEMISLRNTDTHGEEGIASLISNPRRCLRGCTIFLGYTSNMMSSGLREIFCYMAKNDMIDCIVTSAGGIEEDFIKCLDDFRIGDFNLDGSKLRSQHLNRIGNIMAPNSAYCKFENWLTPILDEMLNDQIQKGVQWTPSKMIKLLGKKINNPESVYYWTARNDIPVFCPAITDGSLGDIM